MVESDSCDQAVTDSNTVTVLHPSALSMSTPQENVVLFTYGSTTSEPCVTEGCDARV